MKSPIFLVLALAASTLTAHAQSPADTLQDVRPFSTHALDLLMAREPGVEVISSPGAPGMTPTIHVRGIGVLPGINPLYVVDGMRRRDLDGIAPESIEKIEVLKDAAAMGLWGPDAAAGVVVVTTRRASQQGFHAGYEFAGGFQSLAHTPEKMTMSEWLKHYRYQDPDMKESILPGPETTFLQKHHLYTQYGGKKLSAYAGFSVLDNDGPYAGKDDTHRRYAASWSAEYHPLQWLSLETTGRWNRSSISRAPESWLERYLLSVPKYNQENWFYLYSDRENFSETVIQGQVDIHPLPGLYVRGTGGYAQGMRNLCAAKWSGYGYDEDPTLVEQVDAKAGYEGKKWFQWGIETGWNGQWRDHRLQLNGTFRRIKEKQDNRVIQGTAQLSDIGLKYGDEALLEEKFLLPYYERYKALDWEEQIWESHSNPTHITTYNDSKPEMKWNEGVLSVAYDWKGRYELGFSYFRLWAEKLFSSEGWRVPAVTLGWTLSEEPALRRLLPESLSNWSVKASWSNTDAYVPLLDNLNRWVRHIGDVTSIATFASSLSTAARHRDLTTSLSFQLEGPTLDLSASWYVNDDDLTYYDSYFISGDDITPHNEFIEAPVFTLRNQGIELAGALRQNVGPFRYSLSTYLTFYRNRVRFGDILQNFSYFPWQKGVPLSLKDGEPMGGSDVYHIQDGQYLIDTHDTIWKGSLFPKVTGGIQALLGWNRWQLTVSGHGDAGQTIRSDGLYDSTIRYNLDENPVIEQVFNQYGIENTEYAVHNASFFRIDQLRLDYTLPLRNVRLNLFASLENWFLFTKYPGSDPELALAWNVREVNTYPYTYTPALTGDFIGVETAAYPSTRRTIFGLSINF